MEKFISLIVLLFILSACSNSEDSSTYIYHPTEENLNRDVTFVLSNSNTQGQAEIEQFRDRIENRQHLTSIGNLSGIESEIFSDIFQVEITDSEVLIFERGNFRISRFDFQGNYISDIQATGRGPNEVQQILKMSVSNDTLYIMDGLDVKFLGLTQPDSKIETLYKSKNTAIEDMCSLNEKFLLRYFSLPSSSGPQDPAIFHLFNTESEEIEISFGQPYKANSLNWSQILTEGSVICNEKTDTVINTKSILPYIVAHNSKGMIKWIAEVKDFKPIIHRQHNVPGGSLSFRWHEDSFIHTTFQLLNYEEFLIAQVITYESFMDNDKRSRDRELKIESYLIHNETGKSEFLGSNLPKILAINQNYLILEKEGEFPGIEVFAI